MSWFGYKKQARGSSHAVVEKSDRVLRQRKPSQASQFQNMGSNISLQDGNDFALPPTSPTITQPLTKEQIDAVAKRQVREELMKKMDQITEIQAEGESGNDTEEKEQKQITKQDNKLPKVVDIIKMEEFKKAEGDEKLNLLMSALSEIGRVFENKLENIQTVLTEEEDGVFPRLRDCEATVEEHKDRIDELEETNELLKNDVGLLKGIVQVQARQLKLMQEQIVDIKTRSMAPNVMIAGLTQDTEDEDCKAKVKNFLQNKLQMQEIEDKDIQVAHRLGTKNSNSKFPRQMVVQCSKKLRATVFAYTKNLKDLKNEQDQGYFEDPQLPEATAAERKEVNFLVAELKRKNRSLPTGQKVNFQVKSRKLYINNELQKKKIEVPSVATLMQMSREEYDRIEALPMVNSTGAEENGSKFTAYASKVNNTNHIADLYKAVKIWHPEADHVMMSYRLDDHNKGCADDGEHSAGLKLMKLLQERNETNSVVFVAREHSGKNIGARRFMHISMQAREALNKL